MEECTSGNLIATAAARIARCRRSFRPRRFDLPYLPAVAASSSPHCRVPGSPVRLRGPAAKRKAQQAIAAKLHRAAQPKPAKTAR
jgi:hypothetical protein